MEPTPEQWYQRRIAELEEQVRQRDQQIADLQKQLVRLSEQVAKLSKNSSNSSKPPSSDIVKPPKPPAPPGTGKRHIGGQPGHPRHDRQAFAPEQIDQTLVYRLDRCPDCGGRLQRLLNRDRILQQVEVVPQPMHISEHQALTYRCRHCGKTQTAALPPEVAGCGLIGPNLTAIVAYLKGVCHASFSTIRKFLREVIGVTVSRGQLAKLLGKVSASLAGPYQILLEQLPAQSCLNVDETGHKDNGRGWWTWCFRAPLYTLFKIEPSRGSQVLLAVLGKEFEGVLGCDYFPAYRKYMKDFGITVQFCLAHLIREVKFLLSLSDAPTQRYAERLLEALRGMFGVIHRREVLTPRGFQRALERARQKVLQIGRRACGGRQAHNLARRFRQHGQAYFRFVTTPGLEPTNNLAEQAIRFVVIDRRITQGTRSPVGRQWSERIWTVIATLTQQGRSILTYLQDALHAHLHDQPVPGLLPAGP